MLIIIYLANKNKKKSQSKKLKVDLNQLLQIVSNPNSSTADLIVAIELFNEFINMEEDLKRSLEFFDKLLKHKNRHKRLFQYFHNVIVPNNKEYKKELNAIEKEALNKG
jgi:translation initiation factor IF-3